MENNPRRSLNPAGIARQLESGWPELESCWQAAIEPRAATRSLLP
jgi:hypothetical protein